MVRLQEMVRGKEAWRAAVHGVTESDTTGRLNNNNNICLPRWHSGEELACDAGESGCIPGSRRSPGGGHGNPLQYSCLENPMDRGAWRAVVHRVTENRTRLK